jgi:hypothetical protein
MVEEVPWCELQYAGRATQIRAGTAVDSRNLERVLGVALAGLRSARELADTCAS